VNAVLDVLKLRRVKLDYISPPVCPGLTSSSGSGSSIFVEANNGPAKPARPSSNGRFLTWTLPAGGVCTNFYQPQNPFDSEGPYVLVSECVPANTAIVCSPGWWYVTTTDSFGVESTPSVSIFSSGEGKVSLTIPHRPGDTSFSLFKNPDPIHPAGPYTKVLFSADFNAEEVCTANGCGKIQTISGEGASAVSDPACVNSEPCLVMPCSPGMVWDPVLCSCVNCPEQPCSPGLIWDPVACSCVPCPVLPCPPGMVWSPLSCSCVTVTCPVLPCPPGKVWDPVSCSCVTCPVLPCPNGCSWDAPTCSCVCGPYYGLVLHAFYGGNNTPIFECGCGDYSLPSPVFSGFSVTVHLSGNATVFGGGWIRVTGHTGSLLGPVFDTGQIVVPKGVDNQQPVTWTAP
jgi:hypothetical protein